MKAKEKQLLEYLKKHCPGRENAISGKQMKKRFRIHEAELRKLVHNLRADGAPSWGAAGKYRGAGTASRLPRGRRV